MYGARIGFQKQEINYPRFQRKERFHIIVVKKEENTHGLRSEIIRNIFFARFQFKVFS